MWCGANLIRRDVFPTALWPTKLRTVRKEILRYGTAGQAKESGVFRHERSNQIRGRHESKMGSPSHGESRTLPSRSPSPHRRLRVGGSRKIAGQRLGCSLTWLRAEPQDCPPLTTLYSSRHGVARRDSGAPPPKLSIGSDYAFVGTLPERSAPAPPALRCGALFR